MLGMSVHSWSILSEREAYDMLSFIPICCTIMYVFFQAINALQEPTPNWTNLRRNVSKMSEMSQKFNDSKVVGKVPQRSDASQNDHKSKGYPYKTGGYRHQTFYFIRLFKIRLNSPSQDGTWSTLNAAVLMGNSYTTQSQML